MRCVVIMWMVAIAAIAVHGCVADARPDQLDRVAVARKQAEKEPPEKYWSVSVYSGGECVEHIVCKGERPYDRGLNGEERDRRGFTFWSHTGERIDVYGGTIIVKADPGIYLPLPK